MIGVKAVVDGAGEDGVTVDEICFLTNSPRAEVCAALAGLVFRDRSVTCFCPILPPKKEGGQHRVGTTRYVSGDPTALITATS